MIETASTRLVVIDTNVLVSAFMSSQGQPFRVVVQVFHGQITPCYDQDIFEEYIDVLNRPKFGFDPVSIKKFVHQLQGFSYYVFSDEINTSSLHFSDEDDRKFYNLALSCNAELITGNKKHFPNQPWIMSPSEFLAGR